MIPSNTHSKQVLDGVRVLDLGNFITAPYAAMLLAEMGADVIKVERPGTGDPFRAFNGGLYSSHFQAHNRNKRSLTLDYTKADAKEAMALLLESADVILINVRPGVEERLGLAYDSLKLRYPALIYASITGYGSSGPYAERPAYDNVGQSLSGWLSMFHQGTDARVPGPAVSDALTGMYAALGILGALVERSKTGLGRKVEVSMLEATVAFSTEPLGKLFDSGEPVPFYSRSASSQSFIVTCKDGLRIGLHLSSPEKFWESLTKALERPDLLTKYPNRNVRVSGYDYLAIDLAETFITQNREYWMQRLEEHDVPFAPERRLEELESDPQVQHLGMFYEAQHPKFGAVKAAHRPVRFDGDNNSNFSPPPELGEHTYEVFKELGMTRTQIETLSSKGVI
jgi:crotonobetainyl-CoA:carnitine CoA-transferase CaiB-like acyl-CoA transferase